MSRSSNARAASAASATSYADPRKAAAQFVDLINMAPKDVVPSVSRSVAISLWSDPFRKNAFIREFHRLSKSVSREVHAAFAENLEHTDADSVLRLMVGTQRSETVAECFDRWESVPDDLRAVGDDTLDILAAAAARRDQNASVVAAAAVLELSCDKHHRDTAKARLAEAMDKESLAAHPRPSWKVTVDAHRNPFEQLTDTAQGMRPYPAKNKLLSRALHSLVSRCAVSNDGYPNKVTYADTLEFLLVDMPPSYPVVLTVLSHAVMNRLRDLTLASMTPPAAATALRVMCAVKRDLTDAGYESNSDETITVNALMTGLAAMASAECARLGIEATAIALAAGIEDCLDCVPDYDRAMMCFLSPDGRRAHPTHSVLCRGSSSYVLMEAFKTRNRARSGDGARRIRPGTLTDGECRAILGSSRTNEALDPDDRHVILSGLSMTRDEALDWIRMDKKTVSMALRNKLEVMARANRNDGTARLHACLMDAMGSYYPGVDADQVASAIGKMSSVRDKHPQTLREFLETHRSLFVR